MKKGSVAWSYIARKEVTFKCCEVMAFHALSCELTLLFKKKNYKIEAVESNFLKIPKGSRLNWL
jgi:hypothetical protein